MIFVWLFYYNLSGTKHTSEVNNGLKFDGDFMLQLRFDVIIVNKWAASEFRTSYENVGKSCNVSLYLEEDRTFNKQWWIC